MGGFLRFLTFFVALVAVFGLVVVPVFATPLLTGMVRDMGLRSETLRVSIELFDPLVFVARARRLHLTATNVDVSPGAIGSVDLTLGGVSFFDRSWETIDGELRNLSVTTGGRTFTLSSVSVSGDASAADTTARLSGEETESIIRFAAQRAGLELDRVQVTDTGVRVVIGEVAVDARLEVRGGALVLQPGLGIGAVPLIQPAPSDAWQLTESWFSDGGLNLRGVVDTHRVAALFT